MKIINNLSMKAFKRTLNIEERKAYSNIILYTFFQCISTYLIKTMNSFEISNLTVLCQVGCLMSLICLARIIISLKRDKSKREEYIDMKSYKSVMFRGLFYFFSFMLMIFSLYNLTLSTFFIIKRLSLFLSMYINQYLGGEIKNFQIFGIVIAIIGTLVIIFPSFTQNRPEEGDSVYGILFCILATIFKSINDTLNKHWQTAKLDIVILFIGIYSSSIGCFFILLFYNGMSVLNFHHWLLLLLTALCMYYSIFFQIKVFKSFQNLNRLIFFNFIAVLISIFVGIVFFGQIFLFHDLMGILIILINNVIFFNSLIKDTKSNLIPKEQEYLTY